MKSQTEIFPLFETIFGPPQIQIGASLWVKFPPKAKHMRQMMGFFKDSDHRQDEQECLWTFPGFGLTKILDISRLSNNCLFIMLF